MTAEEIQNSSVEKVLEAVRNGTITAGDALAAENSAANRNPRVTLVTALEEIITSGDKEATEEVTEEVTEEATEEFTVKVSEKVIRNTGGLGAYFDPIQKVTIGKEPIKVKATNFVNDKLARKELVRA